MNNRTHEDDKNTTPEDNLVEVNNLGVGLMTGTIYGGLAGAEAMVLLAPQAVDEALQIPDHRREQAETEEVKQESQAMVNEGSPPINEEKEVAGDRSHSV
jgi:hypothetical protein